MIYRIYTEDKPESKRIAMEILAAHGFMGATFYKAQGLWDGKLENSLVIELAGVNDDLDLGIRNIASNLRRILEQESVMIVKLEGEVSYV